MKKFEYKTISIPTKGWMKDKHDIEALDAQLNELGKQGWELAVSMNNIYISNSYVVGNLIVLKREINS